MNPKEFTKNQKVRVIYGFDGMHIKDDDVYELMQKYADLQLLQACVSSQVDEAETQKIQPDLNPYSPTANWIKPKS